MKVVRNGLDLSIIPQIHKRTLVWIHGLGDNADAFCDDFFKEPLMPDCKMILPTASLNPVTICGGEIMTSWFDIAGYNYNPTFEPSVERINSILREESKHTDCLMIGGFSQGAVMSLYCGLSRYEGNVNAIIALSGFAIPMEIPPHKLSTPVLLYHGAQDDRIPLQDSMKTIEDNLKGVNYHMEVHPSMPHEVYLEEYDFIRNWLRTRFSFN
ncbi:hypothetical protein SteCoe_19261 [Stentor coeruleus]|uniref:Phospholipase/carboxylesterase/thioesterase domain-containing protein n=1 Tax=Stentor coeruleus TaxID=5963 RepID=A0A1R2BUM0_9CILI|nr:hypothetical protein SteCoe_19261 [Stentor coeruleus]